MVSTDALFHFPAHMDFNFIFAPKFENKKTQTYVQDTYLRRTQPFQ